ncbi:adenylyltransferase [Microbacterium phage PauloDiaboli]|nr:adenylyltransferase [Microbacterium phage PauloDiaboli]
MTQAYVLMTALPPTYGHLDLIQFAGNLLSVDKVVVFLNTQPEEPMVHERYMALWNTMEDLNALSRPGKFSVRWQNETTQQEPEGDDEAFWDNWIGNLHAYGFEDGDFIVASESYGYELAKRANGVFMPYDPDRWSRYTKGTSARTAPFIEKGWAQILPHFRHALQKRVTIFGAESTGKTTLTKALSDAYWDMGIPTTKLFEWARPYLEMTDPEVTVEAMHRIWEGQRALQWGAYENVLAPLVLQDTDLYTTVGFWENWDPASMPSGILFDAGMTKSDLYIILRSNIPFEPDILRTGGDKRETSDQYWVDICEKYGLSYVVLEESSLDDRVAEAMMYIAPLLVNPIKFKRQGAEYE